MKDPCAMNRRVDALTSVLDRSTGKQVPRADAAPVAPPTGEVPSVPEAPSVAAAPPASNVAETPVIGDLRELVPRLDRWLDPRGATPPEAPPESSPARPAGEAP